MNSHFEQAVNLDQHAYSVPLEDAVLASSRAQTHALLALAYEQRTANLIEALKHGGKFNYDNKVMNSIRERLGLVD